MIIINSAAYVDAEFRNEFGNIPPCLLPLGNRKLIELQVATLRKYFEDPIVVSLPQSYEITVNERNVLRALGVQVVQLPDSFSLAQALIYLLNICVDDGQSLRLLHGDTLIEDLPAELDCVAVGLSQGDYNWEVERELEVDQSLVWSGFFSFSSRREFLRALTLSSEDFVAAVRRYAMSQALQMFPCQQWFDLGHINTYFYSRSKITTQRAFNELRIEDGVLIKTGTPSKKILAEAYWFKRIPLSLKKYVPQLIEHSTSENEQTFYALEYLTWMPLNELFVHGRNSANFWTQRLTSIQSFLCACVSTASEIQEDEVAIDALNLYESKTRERLQLYANSCRLDLSQTVSLYKNDKLSISQITDDCIARSAGMLIMPAVIHGDLCLSNILFDSRSQRIKFIDPRGLNFNNEFTIYGDQKYDIAKLAHSLIGLYDFIIAGRYSLAIDEDGFEFIHFDLDERLVAVQSQFLSMEWMPGVPTLKIMPLVVLLFLSMLPLHADKPERQHAMLLNAIRLYKSYC